MNKVIGITLILLATAMCATAQNERDAFRYSQYLPAGSARYTSLSGSMGAFGSDFSCLSAGNPAGLGLFKRFEFSFSPVQIYNKNVSTYNGEQRKGTDYPFNLNNIGVVFVFTPNPSTKWKAVQFGTGMNNLARYRNTTVAMGSNEGMTNYLQFNDIYSVPEDIDLDQQFIKKESGYLNEYVFSFGGNYNDKLFLGATIGIPFFDYRQDINYTESSNPFYDSLICSENFISKATGINLKLGIIYQPLDFLRVGAAFHTPTKYPRVKETYTSSIDVWLPVDSTRDLYVDENGIFNYGLRTPYRATANVAFIYKNHGFINLDYEYADYSTSELESNTYDFKNENKNIKTYYTGTHTFRIGGELNLSPVVFRVGGSYSTNPYKNANINGSVKDGSLYTVSGGIGYKAKIFFADFAYMYRFSQDKDVFYNHESLNPYASRITSQYFVLTLGWKLKM